MSALGLPPPKCCKDLLSCEEWSHFKSVFIEKSVFRLTSPILLASAEEWLGNIKAAGRFIALKEHWLPEGKGSHRNTINWGWRLSWNKVKYVRRKFELQNVMDNVFFRSLDGVGWRKPQGPQDKWDCHGTLETSGPTSCSKQGTPGDQTSLLRALYSWILKNLW